MINWCRRTRPQSEYLKNMVEHDNFLASLDEIESKLEVGRTQNRTILISKHLSHEQVQQLRGQLLHLEQKLNEHLDYANKDSYDLNGMLKTSGKL